MEFQKLICGKYLLGSHMLYFLCLNFAYYFVSDAFHVFNRLLRLKKQNYVVNLKDLIGFIQQFMTWATSHSKSHAKQTGWKRSYASKEQLVCVKATFIKG